MSAMSGASSIKVGIIGTGFGSLVQIPAFQRTPGVQVVAVASGSAARAREVAQRFGIPAAYDDYRRLLAEQELDLVSVVTPPYLHHEMVLAAVERGCHVLCEKPLALNLAQAREMLAAAERAGVVHAVDHEFRYLPPRARMKELVEAGYLGELRTVRVSVLTDVLRSVEGRPWNWWSEREKGGGILGAFGSHLIDSLRWWFGEIVEVAAQVDTFVRRRPLPDGSAWREVTSDDQVAALLRLANGAQVTFYLSGVTRPAQNRFEAYGATGTLIIDEGRLLGAREDEPLAPIELTPLPPPEAGDDWRIPPFRAFLDRFLAQVRGESGQAVASFRDGAAVQAVMDAMHRSAAERCFVKVEPVEQS